MELTTSWPATAALVTVTAITTTTILVFANNVLWPRRDKTLPSPLKTTLPTLPQDKVKELVYQPDQFPGARDVQTPVSVLLRAPRTVTDRNSTDP